jgi:hypothetical protein
VPILVEANHPTNKQLIRGNSNADLKESNISCSWWEDTSGVKPVTTVD